jgi:hypothetical protein
MVTNCNPANREVNVIIDWIIGQISDRPPGVDVAVLTKAPYAPAHLIAKKAPACFKQRFNSVSREFIITLLRYTAGPDPGGKHKQSSPQQ